LPHRRYLVIFRHLDGSTKQVRVITNRGQAKAIHLASLGTGRLLVQKPALET